MTGQFGNTLLYSLIAGGATFAGVYMIFFREAWARRNSVLFLGFSAGVILAVVFTHILPEAIEMTEHALTVTLFTLIGFFILEHTILIHTCQEDGSCEVHSLGMPSYIGITFHSLIDGVIIGIGFEVDYSLGIMATIAILLHKLPVGITISSLLLHAGYSKKQTIILGSTVAAATVVGAVGAYAFMGSMSEGAVGVMLAFSAGTFIYIGASDLIPETHKNFGKANIPLVLAGVILVYIVAVLMGGHDGRGHRGHIDEHEKPRIEMHLGKDKSAHTEETNGGIDR